MVGGREGSEGVKCIRDGIRGGSGDSRGRGGVIQLCGGGG